MFAKLFCRSCSDPGVRDVSPAEAVALRTQARLVDVREPHEWHGDLGHVQGAELVPLATVEKAARGWDRDAPVVVICRSGGRSSGAAAKLARLGFTKIHNMAGGMLAYNAAGLPVVRS